MLSSSSTFLGRIDQLPATFLLWYGFGCPRMTKFAAPCRSSPVTAPSRCSYTLTLPYPSVARARRRYRPSRKLFNPLLSESIDLNAFQTMRSEEHTSELQSL